MNDKQNFLAYSSERKENPANDFPVTFKKKSMMIMMLFQKNIEMEMKNCFRVYF